MNKYKPVILIAVIYFTLAYFALVAFSNPTYVECNKIREQHGYNIDLHNTVNDMFDQAFEMHSELMGMYTLAKSEEQSEMIDESIERILALKVRVRGLLEISTDNIIDLEVTYEGCTNEFPDILPLREW